MAEELWKFIPEFPKYQASNLGNIRNAITHVVLKPVHVPNGYSQVKICLGSRDKFKCCRVHRLVAMAWIPNPDNKPTVNHKTRNKFDNSVENLEWATHQEQAVDFASKRTEPKSRMQTLVEIEGEEWRPLKTTDGYFVSNMGRIKNPRDQILSGHRKGMYAEVKIKDSMHVPIHRAVAEAFCEEFSKDKVVNHKDGNRMNNKAENLECITQSENIKHAYDSAILKRRIPIIQRFMDGEIVAEYESFLDAMRQTGFKDGSIRWAIKHGNGVRESLKNSIFWC